MTIDQPDPTMNAPTTPTHAHVERDADKAATRDAKQAVSGTVQDVKDWVGEDQSRARFALDAENEQDSPRKSLVSHLEKLSGN